MTKLYELTDAYKQLELHLENGDIDLQTFLDTVEEIQDGIEEKLVNIKKLKAILDSDMTGIQGEIDRLTKLKKSKQNHVNNLEYYAHEQLKKLGKTKFDTPIGEIKIQKGRESVQVDVDQMTDADLMKYTKTKLTATPDKTAIKKAIKDGEEIKGAEIIRAADSVKM